MMSHEEFQQRIQELEDDVAVESRLNPYNKTLCLLLDLVRILLERAKDDEDDGK